ncbi:PAS domain-containing protein [Kamptonema animale CS-326]|jgi:PAS domain S-box-containing protein|uniref:PAS domain-containing protein n=1 Tax=Kamptonema animale TaxID=92934 RepID=UPI00232E5625|nr:PAS domain-containing protein [Kamptonema animale]MDB9509768.1 PAS domain-containing protein [Kamptonema animale CS-326]
MSSPLGYDPLLDLSIDEEDFAQQSLRDRQLRTLFEMALDGMAIADDQGRYLDVNPAACELFGLKREELLGRCIFEFAEPGFNFQQAWQEFQQQEKVRGEFRLVRADGDIRIVEFAATANFLPHRHLSVMRDITQSKRAEARVQELTQQLERQVCEPVSELEQTQAQLRESQQRLESILNSVEGVVWSIHPETYETIYINPAVEQIFGCSVAEFFSNPNLWFEIIHPNDRDKIANAFVRLKEKGKTRTEYRIIRRDGQVRWLSVNSYLVYDETGKPIRIDGITTDISDRIESQSRLEQIARHIPGAIYQFRQRSDGSFHFPYSSEGIREICGVSPEEVREDASPAFGAIHPDDCDRVTQSLLESASHLTPWYCEYRACLPDERMLWLVGNATPQREPDGSTLWHGYIRDITDSKSAEAHNQRLLAILEITPDLIGTADVTGQTLYLNRSWRNLLDINNNAAIAGMEISNVHPEWALDIVLNQGLPEAAHSGSWYGETAILDPTGREIPVSQLILAHKSTEEKVEYFSTIIRDITESKAIELALRISENKFRSIIENLNDMVYIINPDTTFSYVSPQFKEVMGYELANFLDASFSHWIYPEDLAICVDAVDRSLQGEKLRGIEYRFLHQDGNYYWHSSNVSALRDYDGQVVACLGIARYIHDRKQAEIALQESNSRWQLALEGAGDGTWDWNIKTNEMNFSRQWKAMLGYAEDEIPNALEEWQSRVHPEDKAQCNEDFSKHLKGETSAYRNEHRLRCKDGSYKWILDRGQVVEWDKEGQPLRFIGTHCDISDRKAAEKNLRQNEQKYHQILDALTEMVLVKGPQSRIVWANKAFRDYYGLTNEQLRDMIDAPFNEPDYTLQYIRDDAYVFETGKTLEIEEPVTRYDGKVQMFNTIKSVIRNEVGETILTVGVSRDISDRKAAEIAQQQLTRKLEEAQRVAHIGNWSFDLATQKITWSAELFRIFGINPEQGEPTFEETIEKYYPEDRELFISCIQAASEQGIPQNFDIRICRADGAVRYINNRMEIERHDRKIVSLFGTVMDITDRKEAETELNKISERLSLALKSGGIGCWEWDLAHNTLFWDERMYELYGVTKNSDSRLAYDIWRQGLHPDDREACETLIHQAVLGQAEYDPEFRVIDPDGSIHFIKAFGLVRRDAEGNPQKMIGVNFDITDRKRQEQALRLIVEGTAAKTGEEFFKSCVQYLAQVLGVRYAAIAEFANPEKSIVQTLAFWAGDNFGDNFTCNLAGTACKNTPCKNIDNDGEVCRYPNSVDCLFPQDDTLVTLQTQSYAGLPIIDAAGNRLGLLEVMDTKPMEKDLEMQSAILKIFATRAGAEMERIQAEAAVRRSEIQLRQQTEELEITLKKLQNTQTQLIQAEKMSSLGQLVAGVAHEINNPVSFIYSNIKPASDYASDLIKLIHLYQEYYPSPPAAISNLTEDIEFEYLVSDFSNLLESMKTGATRIGDIVKSLRTFSRLDEADFKEIDIHENIDSTLVILQNRLNGRAGKPEIPIILNYGNLPLVECYGGLLNQVFMNLLVNAIDAIEQQRDSLEAREISDYIGCITITTSIYLENQVVISIQDNGCGMSPQIQEKIFNPFFTTKPVGKGTGMGLATSYQIVKENHQGYLRCFSTVGKGTEFRIELPICQEK